VPTEQEVRRWVREEREQIRLEEQAACRHPSGTFTDLDLTCVCDFCGKILTRADWDKDSGATSVQDAKARVPM
jgi:hypothetical protein